MDLNEMYVVETPQCSWCGNTGTVEMGFIDYIRFNERGTQLIQDVLPDYPVDVREQLKTGYHPKCWTEMFGSSE